MWLPGLSLRPAPRRGGLPDTVRAGEQGLVPFPGLRFKRRDRLLLTGRWRSLMRLSTTAVTMPVSLRSPAPALTALSASRGRSCHGRRHSEEDAPWLPVRPHTSRRKEGCGIGQRREHKVTSLSGRLLTRPRRRWLCTSIRPAPRWASAARASNPQGRGLGPGTTPSVLPWVLPGTRSHGRT